MSGTTGPPPEAAPSPAPSTLALVGAKWVSLAAVVQRTIQMGTAVLLARLLVPEDFGVFAVVSVSVDTLNALKELGMPTALIRLRDGIDEAASTFFYLSVVSAALVCGATWVAAPQLAAFVGSPLVVPVLRAMVFKTVFESASIVQRTLAVRALSVGRVTMVAFLETALVSASAIALAASGFGVWSLVWGALGGSAFSALVWWCVSSWRPRARLSPGTARLLLGFGTKVSGAWAIESVTDTLTRALIGRWQSVVGLGYQDLAARMAIVPIRSLTLALGHQVALPAMCLVQRDTPRLASWYIATLRAASALTLPLAVSLVALPDYFVLGVCGHQWAPAVPLLRLLGPAVFVLPMAYAPRPVYVATGRVHLLLRFALLQMALLVPGVIVAARVSLEAVCAVQLATLAVVATGQMATARRLLALSWRGILRAVCTPLEAVAGQALLLVGLRSWLRLEPTAWSLLTLAAPGLIAYAAILQWRQPELVADLLRSARRALALTSRDSQPDADRGLAGRDPERQ